MPGAPLVRFPDWEGAAGASRAREVGMNLGKFVFAQVMEHLPLHVFHRCVVRYSGEHKYHLGFRSSIARNTLANANATLGARHSLR